MKKRTLSLLLCIVMCLSLIPMSALAEENFEFRKLPTTEVTNITVPEGDYYTGVAAKDAFILYWKENIKTDGNFMLIDYFYTYNNGYHSWTITIEDGVPVATDGGFAEYYTTLDLINDNPFYASYDKWVNGTYTVNHTHNPELVNGQAPQKGIAGWKDYYECTCGECYEDASGSILIPDLAVWKAEGGNGYIPKLEPTPEPEPEPDPINYKIIEGAQSTWSLDDVDDSPLFRSDADFSKFVRVELDGKVLDPANYTAKPGSTIIELKPAFVAKLAPGKHTIEIVSTDGSASTVFYIEETIANTDGEGFALSTATMSSAFIGCNIVGLAVVFFELKKKKKVR